jgi:tetratricopeptide (TPR) repeat protein
MPRALITSWSAARLGWLVGFCALGQPALGQQAVDPQTPSGHDRVGMRVIQKLPEFRFRVGNQLIRPRRVEIYRVVEDHGRELMISVDAKGLKGLVESDQVIAVEHALDFCNRYIEKIPDDSWGYYLRANIWHLEKKDLEKAAKDFNAAISRTSESPRFRKTRAVMLCGRGAVWAEKKDFDRAIADYSTAVELDPSEGIVHQLRANALIWKQKYDQAIDDLDEAIALRPEDAALYYDRGRAWHEKRGYDKAIDDFSHAIVLRPYYTLAFVSRGATWSAKKAYDRALADFNTAIRLEPNHPRGYIARAWLQATCPDPKLRSGNSAVESATRACELSAWKSAESLDPLAAAYAETGDFNAAVKWQAKAIELTHDERKIKAYRDRLKLYRQKKSYHRSEL